MTDANEWQGQVGQSWASEWRRTDRSFGKLTEQLLQRSRELNFESILDIGCGAGEISLALARGRPSAQIVGIDISPQLLAVANERGKNHPNAQFVLADAGTWEGKADFVADVLISRHGVMFFADPPKAFANLAHISGANAQLLFSCFRSRNDNPFFTEIARLLPPLPGAPDPDPFVPGPFAFADKDHVAQVLSAGGWTDIEFEAFDFGMVAGAGEDPVNDALAYFTSIGPAAAAARDLPSAACAQFLAQVRMMAQDNLQHGIVALRAATWIVAARKA